MQHRWRTWLDPSDAPGEAPAQLLGSAALALVIGLVAGVLGTLQFAGAHFAGGGALILGGAALLAWPRALRSRAGESPDALAHPWLALLFVGALAVFFRIYQLEPPGLWGDEAINGLRSLEVLDGTIQSPFQLVDHPHTAFHALTNYPIAAAFYLFGPGPISLRLPGMVAGIACVFLLYATAVPLFGARVALMAALFFASSPTQIAHAKGLTQIVFGECAQLAGLCLLVRGVVGHRRWLMEVAGAPLGLCVYMYHSAKLAPAVALALFAWPLARRDPERPAFLWWLGVAIVFIVTALPGALAYVANPQALTGRASGVSLMPALRQQGNLWPLWDAVWRTLTIHLYQQGPVDYHWFGLGTDPASNAIVAFLAVAGFLLSVRRWRETRHGLLLVWFFFGLIPGFLSSEAPRGYRVLYASPPIYIWAALPLAHMWRAAAAPGLAAGIVRATVVLVLVAVPFVDFNAYFYRVYTHPVFRWFQGQRMVEMARTLRSYGPGWTGVLMSDSFDARYETLLFLARAWGLRLRNGSGFADELPVRTPDAGVLFIFDAGTIPASVAPRAFYPDVPLDVRMQEPQRSWAFDAWMPLGEPPDRSRPIAAFFPVSRDTVAASHGLLATFSTADGSPQSTRIDHQLDFASAPAAAGTTRWTGAIYAPTDGLYGFSLQASAPAAVAIDRRPLVTNERPEALEPLAQGLHALTADAVDPTAVGSRLLWRPPGASSPASVDGDALFRFSPVFGLRAEYEVAGRSLARIEPYPFYAFFAPTFAHPFTVRWRGSLQIPADRYHLEWGSNGQAALSIDGQRFPNFAPIKVGRHDLDLVIRGVPPVARLQFYWHRPDGVREPVPPTAFEPPRE